MLFHYHFWTPYVEETERFYIENGFRVSLRAGNVQGKIQRFDPPLTWDDFREREIKFRIIEVRKGAVNITFGYGKKVMFDHIGFLVKQEEHDVICQKAAGLKWKTSVGERRTFIGTPYGFRIELQAHSGAIDQTDDFTHIEAIELTVKKEGLKEDLASLFNEFPAQIRTDLGNRVTLTKALIKGVPSSYKIDPNGVQLIGSV